MTVNFFIDAYLKVLKSKYILQKSGIWKLEYYFGYTKIILIYGS